MTVNAQNDIQNIALVLLGQRSATSPSEQTKASQFATDRYESVRDMVLAAGLWNSATTRAVLSLHSTAPVFGFANQYQLPNDFLRMKRLNERNSVNIHFRIEALSNGDGTASRVLLTDESEANLIYIFRLTEVAKMDELLKNAIAAQLAFQITLALKGDMQQVGFFKSLYQETMDLALFIDANQAPVDQMIGDLWLNSRAVGSGGGFRDIENVTS